MDIYCAPTTLSMLLELYGRGNCIISLYAACSSILSINLKRYMSSQSDFVIRADF